MVPAAQHGAGCGVQVCEGVGSRGVAGAGCDGAARAADAVFAAPASPWCGARWGVAMAGQRTRQRRSTLGGGWRLSYFVLFYTVPTPRLPPRLLYSCVQPQQGSSAPPTVLLLVWRSGPTQSQLGASSLAYRRTAIMRRAILRSGPPGPSAQAFVGLGEGGEPGEYRLPPPSGRSAPS